MKKIVFICLLAMNQALFAQNIDLKEIEYLISARSTDSIDNILMTKGFQKVKLSGNSFVNGLQAKEGWRFPSALTGEIRSVTILCKFVDSLGRSVYKLETSNPFFYSHLLNQLSQNNYNYNRTVSKEKEANMIFSNNKYEIVIRISSEIIVPNYYQINIKETAAGILPQTEEIKKVTVTPRNQ